MKLVVYRPYVITSLLWGKIESMQKYTEVAATLSGKNVQWVAVGNSISCC